jgi:hypothetical protein
VREGLALLWEKTLREGVDDTGDATFTRFSFAWGDHRTDVLVQPFKNEALATLRGWLYGAPVPSGRQRRILDARPRPLQCRCRAASP